MAVVQLIWNHIVDILGTLAVAAFLAFCVFAIIERIRLRNASAKKREKTTARPAAAVRRIAVITGASSGLGKRYAAAVSKNADALDVNEIWLIARRKERLEETADMLHLPVRTFSLDLTRKSSLAVLEKALADEAEKKPDFSVSLLINCAGFGKFGKSAKIGRAEECRMIRLNDNAAISVTDICQPYMKEGARIAEVCSVAGFQPIPGLNAYAASKALIYSYSRALRIEMLPRKISVTAVCPYWVTDTEFIRKASGRKRKFFLASRSENVVKRSLSSIRKRHAVSTPGIICTLDRIFAGIIPDGVMAYIMKLFI